MESTDITGAALSGNSYTTPALTSAKTYTLTVTGTGGNTESTTCTVTPTSLTISAVSPANPAMGPGQQSFGATVTSGATNSVTRSANGGTFSGNTWTSPMVAGNYTITAASVDEPTVTGTTTATVSLPMVAGKIIGICNSKQTARRREERLAVCASRKITTPQGLKPQYSQALMPELKLRPPQERRFSGNCKAAPS